MDQFSSFFLCVAKVLKVKRTFFWVVVGGMVVVVVVVAYICKTEVLYNLFF